jgi:alcohol dehydrogenase class IV
MLSPPPQPDLRGPGQPRARELLSPAPLRAAKARAARLGGAGGGPALAASTESASSRTALAALTLHQPAQIRFGIGCADAAAGILGAHGRRHALLVSSASVLPRIGPLLARWQEAGIAVTPTAPVPAEPDTGALERTLTAARQTPFDCVIGCGGGSVLDVAKLVAALHDRTESVRQFFGSGLLPGRRTFLVCLPTTAGSGSEVSPNALLRDGASGPKQAVISPWLVPDVALVDPALTASQPPLLTAATGLDALTHCLEVYTNRFAHPLVDLWALEGVRLIAAHLPGAVRHGDDLAARSAVALGSLYGGLGLGPVNTAAVHALAYPLAAEFGIAHGLSNALLLVPVTRFNLAGAPRRYAAIARALGATAAADDLATAGRGVARLEALVGACGVPRGLSACGVTAAAIPRLAAQALQLTRLLRNNPRELTARDAEQIYHEAL